MASVGYDPPWMCYAHGFVSLDKEAFFTHMGQLPHYQEGTNGTCERCNAFLPKFKLPYRGLSEPSIILCDVCIQMTDSLTVVRKNRKSLYPKLRIENL